jgi:DNA-binding MarR family transcriptional regulator
MENYVEKFAELSNKLYLICSRKEMIRRRCLNLGRMECDLLHYLNAIGKPVCMNDLAVAMKVSHSRITRIIDTLVRKKLVHRFPSRRDRRSWLAQVTKEGKKASDQTTVDFLNLQKDLIEKLPQEEIGDILHHINVFLNAYNEALMEKEKASGK